MRATPSQRKLCMTDPTWNGTYTPVETRFHRLQHLAIAINGFSACYRLSDLACYRIFSSTHPSIRFYRLMP